MAAPDVRPARPADATARRVEEILDHLSAHADPAVARTAEDLVGALMEFYGSGLARVVALLSGRSGSPLEALLDDELAAGLLVLHGLHPDDLPRRVQRALRAADAQDTEVTALDAEAGLLRLRQEAGSGCGCGAGTARERIEDALACFAPEIGAVEFDEPDTDRREPVLLQIGSRPPGARPADAR
ncbi:hypothetical protein [Actinacidiphila rubida]|uniref:NifU-like protein n=1 Tax=Actinacidiphila rubida TaxID=310780 RepID=A0A1H8SS69_9ACTN|nr:hypothetical protein [Actinacidiphila rubida]SEO81415.1 hypothetical protein SAMN05216267_104521 [Actinacidiphila rubida]